MWLQMFSAYLQIQACIGLYAFAHACIACARTQQANTCRHTHSHACARTHSYTRTHTHYVMNYMYAYQAYTTPLTISLVLILLKVYWSHFKVIIVSLQCVLNTEWSAPLTKIQSCYRHGISSLHVSRLLYCVQEVLFPYIQE